jgi:hypothetical protein
MTELLPHAPPRVQAPLGRMAAGGLGRMTLAACLLTLAALLVTTSGGAGLRGALGSLFDSHSPHAARATTDRARNAAGAGAALALRGAPVARVQSRSPATGPHKPPHRHGGSHQPRIPAPAPSPSPAPAPQVRPSPSPPRPPTPPSQGVVDSATRAIDQAATALPPPAQPLVPEATGAVAQVCGLLGQCP